MRKYARQIRVIGREGQEKLEALVAVVPRDFAGEIARRYLAGAGMRVEVGREASVQDARFADLDPAAREVALGAYMACVVIKHAIE